MKIDIPVKKGDIIELVVTGLGSSGEGVGKYEGFTVFVKGALPEERVQVTVTLVKKSYAVGHLEAIITASPERVAPLCPVYEACGGCQLQHMDDQAQKEYKEDKVRGCFEKNAGMNLSIEPIIRVEPAWHYRNKVQIPVQLNKGKVEMGFYQKHTNRIIETDICYCETPRSNEIAAWIKERLERLSCAKQFRHVLIKHAHRTGEIMVTMIVRNWPFDGGDMIVKGLSQNFDDIVSINVIINRSDNNVILDGKEINVYGRSYIEEELLGCRFRISSKSFYQINPYATEVLYSKAVEAAGLTGKETVIDLYCGTGTIGMIASKHAKKVYGIEIVPQAIEDAKINAKANNITNIDFINADALKGAMMLLRSRITPDVVIVDPPRKGCTPDTLSAIIRMNPERIVYVSCDPATLARDVRILADQGYEPKTVQPVDLFPQTTHVETVVLMSRVNTPE